MVSFIKCFDLDNFIIFGLISSGGPFMKYSSSSSVSCLEWVFWKSWSRSTRWSFKSYVVSSRLRNHNAKLNICFELFFMTNACSMIKHEIQRGNLFSQSLNYLLEKVYRILRKNVNSQKLKTVDFTDHCKLLLVWKHLKIIKALYWK
jgi:hypothetical protein